MSFEGSSRLPDYLQNFPSLKGQVSAWENQEVEQKDLIAQRTRYCLITVFVIGVLAVATASAGSYLIYQGVNTYTSVHNLCFYVGAGFDVAALCLGGYTLYSAVRTKRANQQSASFIEASTKQSIEPKEILSALKQKEVEEKFVEGVISRCDETLYDSLFQEFNQSLANESPLSEEEIRLIQALIKQPDRLLAKGTASLRTEYINYIFNYLTEEKNSQKLLDNLKKLAKFIAQDERFDTPTLGYVTLLNDQQRKAFFDILTRESRIRLIDKLKRKDVELYQKVLNDEITPAEVIALLEKEVQGGEITFKALLLETRQKIFQEVWKNKKELKDTYFKWMCDEDIPQFVSTLQPTEIECFFNELGVERFRILTEFLACDSKALFAFLSVLTGGEEAVYEDVAAFIECSLKWKNEIVSHLSTKFYGGMVAYLDLQIKKNIHKKIEIAFSDTRREVYGAFLNDKRIVKAYHEIRQTNASNQFKDVAPRLDRLTSFL